MRLSIQRFAAAWLLAVAPFAAGLASTDSISDADPAQSGYLPNHNMDPAVVDSSEFGQLWKIAFNYQEQFYAKPLVYTPPSTGVQIVFLASSQNYIRTLNAKTGDILNVRQVQTPFLQAEIGCTDIPNYIGITGTPVIDPNTDTAYFFVKTYIPNFRASGNTGVFNGVYYFYAVNVNTLEDVEGYPILVDGSVADNDPLKYFIGGVILQRPALTQIGSYVYGAFGGHCDLFNYTGTVIGVDITQKKIITNFATEAGPLSGHDTNWQDNGGGGQGGIWMSGMAMATDGARMFFVTGNGQGHENSGTPASGSSGCRTLGEAVVNIGVGDGGKVSLTDYFQPYNYIGMDGDDQDFGSGGICLLDSTVFQGTGVSRIGVTAGKNGKIYIVNADNLGGYKLGPGQTDNVLQVIDNEKPVFGGSGSYPLEGGYIYTTPVGYPTYVYKLGFDSTGKPVFSSVAQTRESSAGRVGVGIPTITTFQGKAGTAILWMCDPDAGLRAWYAVPGSDGYLKTINLPQVNGLNKFQRPAFGDTRLYVTDANGVLYCLGSPVNLPLNCTSPVSFGDVALGSSKTATVTCTAIIDITEVIGATTGDPSWTVNNATLPQGAVKAGTVFTFPVTWDLTHTSVSNAPNASFPNVSPGVKSTALTLLTENAVLGYASVFPISLTGEEVSEAAYLSLTPVNIAFGGLVLNDSSDTGDTITMPFSIANVGLSPLTIFGYGYTTEDLDDDDVDYTNATQGDDGVWDLGYGFTSLNLPDVGTVIQPQQSIVVQVTFEPLNGTGLYQSWLNVWTNGGSSYTVFEASASTAPIAVMTISNGEGGWLPPTNVLMDFGSVAPGGNATRVIQICNEGGSVLTISKSKPPLGVIRATAAGIDLHETQTIPVNECATGTVMFAPNIEPPNVPDFTVTNTWTLNTDDPNFGVHVVQIQGVVHDRIIGPTLANGSARYLYLGCYQDGTNGRLLPQEPYESQDNTNDLCQTTCLSQGYIFAGTEYQDECWCGNNPPPSSLFHDESEALCTFACAGDASEACGGVGGYISIYYDSTKYTPGSNVGPSGPIVVPSVANYISIGCYSEGTNGRALTGNAPAAPAGGMTIEACETACAGYVYFGVEYGGECYCGNTLNAGSAPVAGDAATSGCSMTCAGNNTEYCGGPNRLNMYQTNGTATSTSSGAPSGPTATGPVTVSRAANFMSLGCYTEGTNSRALTGKASAGNANTVESCATSCSGFTYFGVEYSDECYCGNQLSTGSLPATDNGCTMTCAGNSTEYCGGPNRLNMYRVNGTATSTSSGTTSGPTPTGPVTVPVAAGFVSLGCYTEGTNSRALTGEASAGNTNTVESCASSCAGFSYFGVEYSDECYCGNQLSTGSIPATDNGCTMTCAGNSTEYCGGPNRLNMYRINATASSGSSTTATGTTSPTSGPTGPIIVPGNALFAYSGCYAEPNGGRALPNLIAATDTMTVEQCLGSCAAYEYVGIEYGRECWCGNSLNTGALKAASSDCSMTCSGNSTEICGAGNRLSLYQAKPAALSSNFASGSSTSNATGSVSSFSGTVTSQAISGASTGSSFTPSSTVSSTVLFSSIKTSSGTPNSTFPITSSSLSTITSSSSSAVSNSGVSSASVTAHPSSSTPQSGTNSTISSAQSSSSGSTSSRPLSSSSGSSSITSLPTLSSHSSSSSASSTGSSFASGSSNSTLHSSVTITSSSASSTTSGGGSSSSHSLSSSSASSSIRASSGSSSSSGSATLLSSTASGNHTSNAASSTHTSSAGSSLSSSSSTRILSSSSTHSSSTSSTVTGSAKPKASALLATPAVSTASISSPANSSAALSSSSGTVSSFSTILPTSSFSTNSSVTSSFSQTTTSSGLRSSSSVSSSSAGSSSTSSSSSSSSISSSSSQSSSANSTTESVSSSTAGSSSSSSSALVSSSSSSPSSSSTPSSSTFSTLTTSSASSTSSSSSISSSSSAPTFAPTPGQTIGAWVYLGCANETSPRALVGATFSNATGMTNEACQDFCSSNKYNYGLAATENGTDCYCGNNLQSYSALGQTGCSQACSGNSSELCGGKDRLSVYNLTSYIPPTTVKAAGSYVYKGCFTDKSLTDHHYTNTTGMTVESCVEYCQSQGSDYAGLEDSQECYCAGSIATSASQVDDAQCDMLCTGNYREFCGGPTVLGVYYNDPTSLSDDGTPKSINDDNYATVKANTTLPSSSSKLRFRRYESRNRAVRERIMGES
ncbi:WSC-domain-containing protein [Xylona heveae TC161]|uniref:WSC-domain-containing protein n=1 Tax=Xylona heveae (strain CBS 132557 / TC161) TaxID=1328760 RepID=A0A164ZSE0_XYLHT|nr:WSC-domain-containing protein [Xylona heveae TC161]KZF19452.1 WSC-domain-containing protein [Xylona heveae TC161]